MSASSEAGRLVFEGGAVKMIEDAAQTKVGSSLVDAVYKLVEQKGWGAKFNAPADLAQWGISPVDLKWRLPVIAIHDEPAAVLGRSDTAQKFGRIVIDPEKLSVTAQIPRDMDPRAALNVQAMGGMFQDVLREVGTREAAKVPNILDLNSDREIRAAARSMHGYLTRSPEWTTGSQAMYNILGPRDQNWLARLKANDVVPDHVKPL
jgi:hypothetical protein